MCSDQLSFLELRYANLCVCSANSQNMAAPSGKDVSGNVLSENSQNSGIYLFSEKTGALMIRVS